MVRALLFTDFEGSPADPDDVIADALEGGYVERTPGLLSILRDENADPIERFLSCCALCSWADPNGYRSVVQAAAAPADVPWRGASYDRFRSEDDTFGHLAEAVGSSADMIAERGTGAERIEAARALISIADSVQFDRHLARLLTPDIVEACSNDVRDAADRGITRLASGAESSFDLGLQAALLISAASSLQDTWSTDAARRLIDAGPGSRAQQVLSHITG